MYVCMDVWVQKTSQHTARCHTYLSMHQNLLRRRKKWIMSLSSKRRTSILTFRFAGPRDPKRIKNSFSPCHALKSQFVRCARVRSGKLFAAPHGEKCRFDLPGTFWGSLKSKFWKVSQNMLILITETLGLRHFPSDQL